MMVVVFFALVALAVTLAVAILQESSIEEKLANAENHSEKE